MKPILARSVIDIQPKILNGIQAVIMRIKFKIYLVNRAFHNLFVIFCDGLRNYKDT